MAKRGVILSGMRSTGALHLGNYEGALRNWVRLQDEYECYFEIADWHAMTDRTDYSTMEKSVLDLANDWIAAGLDPERCTIFRQSDVKEHAELHLLLSLVTPVGWLERVPTYKDQVRELGLGENASYAFLGYPVLQAADILLYRADTVPVGRDQAAHLELTREIVRRFTHLFGAVFPEPQALIPPEVPLLPGTDGRKMSKSYGNTIALGEDSDTLRKTVNRIVTDPHKVRRNDPGRPEVCTVYAFHRIYSGDRLGEIEVGCRSGALPCTECKANLHGRLLPLMDGMRSRRAELEQDPAHVRGLLARGAVKARVRAQETMQRVRKAMSLPT